MVVNKFYLINYNRLLNQDTNSLIKIYFGNNHSLKEIALDILLNDDRLLDNSLNEEVLKEIIESIEIELVWSLASLPKEYLIANLAYNKVMEIIDEYEVLERRNVIKMLNKRMPS